MLIVKKSSDKLLMLVLSHVADGVLTYMRLMGFGTEIVKPEKPRVGDPLRKWTGRGIPFYVEGHAKLINVNGLLSIPRWESQLMLEKLW